MALDPQKHSAMCTGKKCWERKHHFPIRPIVSQYFQKFHGNKTVFISLFEGNASADLGCLGYALFRDWRSLREPSGCKCGFTIEWGCLWLLYRLSVVLLINLNKDHFLNGKDTVHQTREINFQPDRLHLLSNLLDDLFSFLP